MFWSNREALKLKDVRVRPSMGDATTVLVAFLIVLVLSVGDIVRLSAFWRGSEKVRKGSLIQ